MREMRRKNQKMSFEEIYNVLENNTSGVLSVLGDDEYPYGVPLSYVYIDDKIIFHCAKEGHKIDAIKQHQKVSFTIIDQDEVVAEENATLYKSVIAFGKIRIVEEEKEKIALLTQLTYKYSPAYKDKNEKEIKDELPHVCVMVLDIVHMSGKKARGLM